MSRTTVKRKVVKWESYEPPREWTLTLSCGHTYPEAWDPDWKIDDEAKDAIEKAGGFACSKCGDKKDKIRELEAEIAELKKEP